MVISVLKQLIQMKRFWSSILFGPERKIHSIEKQSDYFDVRHDIVVWLNTVFSIPSEKWIEVMVTKNPYSEIFIFQQDSNKNVPEKIVVKRFIIQLENDSEIFWEGMKRECDALDKVCQFSGMYGIFTPQLYGYSKELCCMVTSYESGDRFVNLLLESPIKVAAINLRLTDYQESLNKLGRWLKEIHACNHATLDNGLSIESLFNKELSEMKIRLEHPEKARPADFSQDICKKILSFSHDMIERTLKIKPPLQLVHGDFTLVNMLYNFEKLSVLDFTYLGSGMPQDDLARIYLDFLNIDSYSFIFSPNKKGSLSSAFFMGYGKEMDVNSDVVDRFYLLKHALININMYTLHWGNRQFLNPFLCRLLYHYQKKFLFNLISA